MQSSCRCLDGYNCWTCFQGRPRRCAKMMPKFVIWPSLPHNLPQHISYRLAQTTPLYDSHEVLQSVGNPLRGISVKVAIVNNYDLNKTGNNLAKIGWGVLVLLLQRTAAQ